MLVYRIEGRDGRGPYNGNFLWKMSQSHSGNSHPNPDQEDIFPDQDHRSFFCGFPTLDHMKVWFKGWRRKLRVAGFRLKVYEIPHVYVRIGDKQLVFRMEQAREVADLPIP